MIAEQVRLLEAREKRAHWKRWGPYLAERAWGTVREDYSPYGDAWSYFPHDLARMKACRWNEDGLGGISDRHGYICFALALWNGRDPYLKERLYGLSGPQGNHGEDVKELYYYLDSTPTHSYMKFLYKYPQAEFPYRRLMEENARRGYHDREFELADTGVFGENRYFDVEVEYAKAAPEDVLVRITVTNRGPETAPVWILPTAWFRNTWSWRGDAPRPSLAGAGLPETAAAGDAAVSVLRLDHPYYGPRWLAAEGAPELLFTENETNHEIVDGVENASPYTKDGISNCVAGGDRAAVNPARRGTKASCVYRFDVEAGGSATVRLRLFDAGATGPLFGGEFDGIFAARAGEADEYYATIIPETCPPDTRNVMRQSFAGLLWSKQFYHYVVKDWFDGDPAQPAPPASRRRIRNYDWPHLYNADVISMPDKWEYPWYAAWDLAFHAIPLALADPDFAKRQLTLMLREWYMHPNGQLPAYEWSFSDVNPPVHAWAAWRVYKIDRARSGVADVAFLERVFHKLLLNFTWWVNRKDEHGNNLFQGGFLGLDNIGVFDRSKPLPTGGHLEQADSTGWMAMYTLNLLAMAMELAAHNPAYEDVASKFWEHFLYIAHAVNHLGESATGMWDEDDGFYYDLLHWSGGQAPLKVRSMVGLIPLFAVETLDSELVDRLPGFKRRMDWFLDNRPELTTNMCCLFAPDTSKRCLLSVPTPERLRRMLAYLLDENEFLSPYGIRSLSRYHRDHPYRFYVGSQEHTVRYVPGESESPMFGGNSNWRGPVWFPVNFLLIESLQKYHYFFGDWFKVECPTGSGNQMTLKEVAAEISQRLTRLFLRDASGRRAAHGDAEAYRTDPHFRDLLLFYEYFDGRHRPRPGRFAPDGVDGRWWRSCCSSLPERRAVRWSFRGEGRRWPVGESLWLERWGEGESRRDRHVRCSAAPCGACGRGGCGGGARGLRHWL